MSYLKLLADYTKTPQQIKQGWGDMGDAQLPIQKHLTHKL